MKEAVREFQNRLCNLNRTMVIYPSSVFEADSLIFLLVREKATRKLVILRDRSTPDSASSSFAPEESGEFKADGREFRYLLCPCNHLNAEAIRGVFSFTRPMPIGNETAVGAGDRIGLATPGHIRAFRRFKVFPVLAQQSIREMVKTGRSPEQVMDDVSWAVFQEGYTGGFGSDADHLKSEEDLLKTFNAGFTMYTIDPSDLVDDRADEYDNRDLAKKFEQIRWEWMKCSPDEFTRMYLDRKFNIHACNETVELQFSQLDLTRIAVRYSNAIIHAAKLGNRLADLFNGRPFDLEVSFDETRHPTSSLEHLFIASELRRLGVMARSIAVHFVGIFEKGIDYQGDLTEFRETLAEHVAISKSCGPYLLSIHSGSDKFSVYPILASATDGLFHLKTAGTSYLESLRVVARHDPQLFREIAQYCMGTFETDRSYYAIGTRLDMIPNPESVSDADLERVFLSQNSGRQLLHVTFGSVQKAQSGKGKRSLKDRIMEVLIDNEEEYYETIAKNLELHLKALRIDERKH